MPTRKLTKTQREMIANSESNCVARLLLDHSLSGEEPQRGMEKLNAYWQQNRTSPAARWIRFCVLRGQVDVLLMMGKLREAELATKRLTRLPASSFARVTAIWTRAEILRRLDRRDDAFRCAMSGLRICEMSSNVSGALGLIREIILLKSNDYLEELAGKHGSIVSAAGRLSPFVDILGTDARSPLQALEALAERIQHPQTSV